MKKIFDSLIEFIKYDYLEKFSFILLLLWSISPVVEYFLKNYFNSLYTLYFVLMIYIVGGLGILSFIIYLFKRIKDKSLKFKDAFPYILILLLLILGIISTILSKDSYLSLFGESYRKEGLIVYVMYTGFILLSSIFKNKKYIIRIFKVIIFSCLIITILPLFNSKFTYVGYANVFHQFNHYGYYLMINVMLSLFMIINSNKKMQRIIYLVVYIFMIFLLIRNDTFGCFLAIICSLVVLFIYSMIKKYKRKNIILLIGLFAITSFCVSHFDIKLGERVNFKSTTGLVGKNISTFSNDIKSIANSDNNGIEKAGTGRGLLWKEAINYTLYHPIIGGGMEYLRYHYLLKNITYNDRPHNIILQISSFIGIPGAIIYIVLILYLAISNLKYLYKDSISCMIYFTAMCYFISSMFGNSMYYTSPYFMILLGLLIGFNKRNLTKE